MSEPTLMNPNPDQSGSASAPDRPSTPDRFDPAKVRVVDVEGTDGTVERFDCYESEGTEKLFRLEEEAVQVRALDWARSEDMNAEAEVKWVDTGLSVGDVNRIRVFGWPKGELLRSHDDIRE